jgi:hypothetical protein
MNIRYFSLSVSCTLMQGAEPYAHGERAGGFGALLNSQRALYPSPKTSSTAPFATMQPASRIMARMHHYRTTPISCVAITSISAPVTRRGNRSSALAMEFASPAKNHSSISRISGVMAVPLAKASRIFMPAE